MNACLIDASEKGRNVSTKTERNLKMMLVIMTGIIGYLGYQVWSLQQGPSQTTSTTAVDTPAQPSVPTPEVQLPVMRLALVGSQGRQWDGEWLGLAVDGQAGERLSLREVYRVPNTDPITRRRIEYQFAAAEQSDSFWLVGRDTTSSLPVLGSLTREAGGTKHRQNDLVPGEVVSAASMSDGRQLAMAMRKDGFWQINVATAGTSETERFILSRPPKVIAANSPMLPIRSAQDSVGREHLLLAVQDPPSIDVLTFADGRLHDHTRIVLPFRPEAMSVYEADAMTASPGPQRLPQPVRMKRFLLVGHRPTELAFMEFELRPESITLIDRKIAMLREAMPEPIASVQPLVRGSRLAGVAISYQGRPLLHVRRLDNGEDTFHNVFPHLSGNLAVTAHEGVALQDRQYWTAMPFSCRRPDGGMETALMAVDREGMTLAINKRGQTSAVSHRDGIILWVVRDARAGRPSTVVPIQAAGMLEGEPFPLPVPPAAETVRDMLAIGEHLGRSY